MGGQTRPFVKRIEREMYAASDAMEFEKAARLRDDLGALQRALEKQAVVLGDGADADVIALAEDPLEVAVQIFYVRGGRIRGQRGWVADRVTDADTPQLVEDFLLQLYAGDADVGAQGDPGPRAADRRRRRSRRCSATSRAAGSRSGCRSAATRRPCRRPSRSNARQALALHKTKRASDLTTRNRALDEIREALDLDEAPLRIECYDVAHLQGTEVVASMVVFEDGLSRKSEYRRFVIKGVDRQNDVASMHEVITRRFRRLLDEQSRSETRRTDEGPMLVDPETGRPRKFAYAPGLVVVDGGQPQVAAAQQALARARHQRHRRCAASPSGSRRSGCRGRRTR